MKRTLYISIIILVIHSGLMGQITEEIINNVPIVRLPFNTSDHEFSPVQTDRGIAYVLFEQANKKDAPRSGEQRFNIVIQKEQGPEIFAENLNTDFIEGPFAIAKDKIFLTKSNVSEDGLNPSKERALKLKIFESNQKDGVWVKPTLIKFPSGDYNYCHPTLNKTGDMMIMASDAAGGFGKMDLYFSYYRNGKWTRPENLGPEINSEGNDWFPYLHQDQFLYFASDAREESEDLDIYEAEFKNGEFKEVVKLADPINTEYDDFGLSINESGNEILFSSARPGHGRDDIYQIKLLKSLNRKYLPDNIQFSIQLEDGDTGERLSKKEVKIIPVVLEDFGLSQYNKDHILKNARDVETTAFVIKTDTQGEQIFNMSSSNKYIVLIDIPDYKESRFIYDPKEEEHEWIISLIPKKIKKEESIKTVITKPTILFKENPTEQVIVAQPEVYIPTTQGANVVFENLYYEYNSATIVAEAVSELEALLKVMNENTAMKVSLTAHTDSRGRADYNTLLSEKRARSAKLYLTRRGISADRIITYGNGESEIRNRCRDGVNCTEEEHKYNRRTEVSILQN